MTGDDNTLVGASAGLKITTGADNVAVGANALDANTTGASNIRSVGGQAALGSNTTADNNTAVGQKPL
jgi:trimeric autotransporter adhesin